MGWLQAVRQDPADQATDFCHYQEPKLFPDETPLQCEQLMKAKQFNADRPSDSAVNAAYLSSVRESGVPLRPYAASEPIARRRNSSAKGEFQHLCSFWLATTKHIIV